MFAKELIAREAATWIPRQNCYSATQVGEFRQLKDKEARSLKALGFPNEAELLKRQANQSIYKVEKLQKYSLTLAHCDDYPRQPEATSTTIVRELRDKITFGDKLINGVKGATEALNEAEIKAHINAIWLQQEKFKAAVKRHHDALASLYDLQLNTHEAVIETLTKVDHLRDVFVDTADVEDISELSVQLRRIISDVKAWEVRDVSVERLEELLKQLTKNQLIAMSEYLESEEIDPVWDMQSTYKALLNERLEIACRRSKDWIQARLISREDIALLDVLDCSALYKELAGVPVYLSAKHNNQTKEMSSLVKIRLDELHELEQREKVKKWMQLYIELSDVEKLNQHSTDKLLLELRKPPCELLHDEHIKIAPIISRLTSHLDQMSTDELIKRIKLLPMLQQHQILDYLTLSIANA